MPDCVDDVAGQNPADHVVAVDRFDPRPGDLPWPGSRGRAFPPPRCRDCPLSFSNRSFKIPHRQQDAERFEVSVLDVAVLVGEDQTARDDSMLTVIKSLVKWGLPDLNTTCALLSIP